MIRFSTKYYKKKFHTYECCDCVHVLLGLTHRVVISSKNDFDFLWIVYDPKIPKLEKKNQKHKKFTDGRRCNGVSRVGGFETVKEEEEEEEEREEEGKGK